MNDETKQADHQQSAPAAATSPEAVKDVAALRPGMTVRVSQKIKEGEKERVQTFEGIITAMRGGQGVNGTMTVRKVSQGIGVERIFPLHLPTITAIRVVKRARVRRAKLHFVRKVGARKLKEKTVS